jgi:capsular exopolysaccharide synthesis family protein
MAWDGKAKMDVMDPVEKAGRTTSPAGEAPVYEEDLWLKDVLQVIRRRRQVFLSVLILGALIGTVLTISRQPQFRAQALVMIEPRKERIIKAEDVLQGISTDQATVMTQIELVKSKDVVEATMDQLGLFKDPEFRPSTEGPNLVGIAADAPVKWLVQWLPEDWLIGLGLAEERIQFDDEYAELAARNYGVTRFAEKLKAKQQPQSYVISISYTDPNPNRAAAFANAIAGTYVNYSLNEKLSATGKANAWLQQRLESLREEVRLAENAVERYRADRGLVEAAGTSLNSAQMAGINTELVKTRTVRAETEAKLRLVRTLRAEGKRLDTLADVLGSELLSKLRGEQILLSRKQAELATSFGPSHPQMKDIIAQQGDMEVRFEAEVDRILRNLENELEVISSRERALNQQLGDLKGESARLDSAEVRLRELQRDAAASRSIYESFLSRMKETEEQKQIITADSSIISRAVPPASPVFPPPVAFLVLGLIGGALGGTMLSFLVDGLDNRVRSARQLEQELKLFTLGVVPKLPNLGNPGAVVARILRQPNGPYTEQIRTVFSSIRLANLDHPPRLIIVTSALPGEGKTTLSCSLGVFASTSGDGSERALVVDVDLRRPRVAATLGIEVERGLVDVLTGECALDDAIVTHEATGLEVIPGRKSVGNPTALLLSKRFREFLDDVRRRYAFVIIDMPPVVGFSDAQLVASSADLVVLVSQWEQTKKDAVRAAQDALRSGGAALIGAVIVQADLDRLGQYSYGYKEAASYYSHYRKYYRDESERAG